MKGNVFGDMFRLMSFGESHGPALGFVLEGLTSGVSFNEDLLKGFLDRRKPGTHPGVSERKEDDAIEVLSGVFEGKFLGTPLGAIVRNRDARSQDYSGLKDRKGHADSAWKNKYPHIDPRGGGRSSGRETWARVAGGALAKMCFQAQHPHAEVVAFPSHIGSLNMGAFSDGELLKNWDSSAGFSKISALNLPSVEQEEAVENLLEGAKKEGDSYGGRVEIRVFAPPPSLGQPVFGKAKSLLAGALMSVGAVRSVELGVSQGERGTVFHGGDGVQYGGIQGGITTGDTITLGVEIKPTSSILDVAKKGRHDPCIVPRASVVLESMVWLVLMDLLLMRKAETEGV